MLYSQSLNQLIELISNVTDAFTTALFVSDPDKKMLSLAGYHSLSLSFDEKTQIAGIQSLKSDPAVSSKVPTSKMRTITNSRVRGKPSKRSDHLFIDTFKSRRNSCW